MTDNTSNEKQMERRHNTYLEHRRVLVEGMAQQQAAFDKHVLTLSVGALGLSTVFLNHFAPKGSRECLCALLVTWASFCLCIVCTLVSFLVGKAAYRRQMAIWDQKYAPARQGAAIDETNCPRSASKCLTVVSLVLFMAGVVFFVIFAYCNL